jgi:hypothetical protein
MTTSNEATVFNVRKNGAVNTGRVDCWAAFQMAINDAAACGGCVYIPPGDYLISKPLVGFDLERNFSIIGDGAGVSVLVGATGNNLLTLDFLQTGARQLAGVTIEGVGFRARGECGKAISIGYGVPKVTIEHRRRSVVIRNVEVVSGDDGNWAGGIEIASAWNVTLSDIVVSGFDGAGNWNELRGVGIQFRRMCVNAHLTNVRCCFWAVGLDYEAGGGPNTEGIFCSNCSMVAVKRGVWIRANPDAPHARVSTLTWMGGMIECRVGGVTGGSAAFHFSRVWTALIKGCQMLAETLDSVETTYAVFAENCHGVVLQACDLNAWHKGVWVQGESRAILSAGNTFTNCWQQTYFGPGVARSRSYGHVLVGDAPNEVNEGSENLIGFC